jgi:hypothetical protein
VNRRAFLVLGLSLPLLASVKTEALPVRRAVFKEVGDTLRMEIEFPELLRTNDRDAMEALSSGWATRLVYELALHRWGTRQPITVIHVEVRIVWNPWTEQYVVETHIDGSRTSRLPFALREDAIRAAVALRVKVAQASQLERGEPNYYVVRVIAQRNPIETKVRERAQHQPTPDTDLGAFSRWVAMFVRSRPRAEFTIEMRSSATFLEVE